MPNVMAALLNTGGALWSMPQSLADAHYYSAVQQRCQKRETRQNLLGAPTCQQVSAVSGPKFTIL